MVTVTPQSTEPENGVTGVSLDKTSITLNVDETATLTATVVPADADNKNVTWTSSDPLVATVANGIVTAKKEGTATITVTTEEGGYTATCTVTVTPEDPEEPQPEWVLINGIKWATCNVDAPGTFAANPEDAGMFYQWNRKKGWSATGDEVTDWDNTVSAGDIWEKINDPCPSGWRVSTKEEFEGLLNSGSRWDKLNGVQGRYFGSGEEKVFFPAAGARSLGSGVLIDAGNNGYYWSSMANGSESAYYLDFNSVDVYVFDVRRRDGYSVRCVAE